MNKNIIILVIALLALSSLPATRSFAQSDYDVAVELANSGKKDFAFVRFLSVVDSEANPRLRENALFATGEYYFLNLDYTDALSAFNNFLSDYPDSKLKPFALFYILNMAKSAGKKTLAKKIEANIINLDRIILLFRGSKEYKVRSPLGSNYRLVRYIDRLEFYSDGKIQAQIFY